MNPSSIVTREDLNGLEDRLFTRITTFLSEKPDILTKGEAMEMLGISHNTLRKLTIEKKILGVHIGSKVLYRRADLEAYMKNNLTVPENQFQNDQPAKSNRSK